MDIKRCYEILELEPTASVKDLKQAYKDIVNVWHPDRFSHNNRLKRKAEKKIKEINRAFELLNRHLSPDPAQDFSDSSESGWGGSTSQGQATAEKQDKTEAIVEAGTGMVLGLWSHLSSMFHRIVEEAKAEMVREDSDGKENKKGGKG